jgi:tetratricopeptide (TPR) repeat protein
LRLLVETVRLWSFFLIVGGVVGSSAVAGPLKSVQGIRARVGQNGNAVLAELRLKSGRLRLALEIATQCLEDDPEAVECMSVKARAASGMGYCDDLMTTFETLRRTKSWTARTATAEGICWLRLGRLADAEAALAEAHQLKPKMTAVLFQQGMLAGRLGEFQQMSHVPLDLVTLEDSEWMIDVLEVWRAMLSSQAELDGLIWQHHQASQIQRARPASIQYALIDCLRWLQVGDPVQADRSAKVGIEMAMHQPRLVACRAEALRRLGHVVEAEQLLTRPWNITTSSAVRDAALARLRVDVGQLARAGELVARAGDPFDPDQVAAAWYLARAEGNESLSDTLEDRFTGDPGPMSRSLNSFIPWIEVQ